MSYGENVAVVCMTFIDIRDRACYCIPFTFHPNVVKHFLTFALAYVSVFNSHLPPNAGPTFSDIRA